MLYLSLIYIYRVLRNRKHSGSFQQFCEGLGKCMSNSDYLVLYSLLPVALCEVSGLFLLYLPQTQGQKGKHSHACYDVLSSAVLTKSYIDLHVQSFGSKRRFNWVTALFVNARDLQAYFEKCLMCVFLLFKLSFMMFLKIIQNCSSPNTYTVQAALL